jgi:hypothetical protein
VCNQGRLRVKISTIEVIAGSRGGGKSKQQNKEDIEILLKESREEAKVKDY